ncbi:MAG: LytR C-terminal domain-containing protein [Eubacteriales bacterium]|nr:LytR C-terminal domain-containing protein [Eubacteriales bacterium]
MVVLLAVLAALFWVVSNNRRQKAERAAYKESLTKMEESEDFETTLSTVRTGLDEETLSSTPVPETESEEKSEDSTEEHAVETAGQSDSEETASEETADESKDEQAAEEVESKELTAEASGMKIVVLNGTTISGVAGNWAAKLKESGYRSVTTSNYGGKVEDDTVIYGPKELTESLKAVFPNCIFSEEAVPADMQTSSVGQAAFDCYIVIGNQDAK